MGCLVSTEESARVGVGAAAAMPRAEAPQWAPPDEIPARNREAEAEYYLGYLEDAFVTFPDDAHRQVVEGMMAGLLVELQSDTPSHESIGSWLDDLRPEVERLQQLDEDRKAFAALPIPPQAKKKRKPKKAF
eukprot:TRINITY_DN3746_c0_g1_i1.p1 TRINITY_DN3746_c0_g1~~TRINITY_DN3746_c0_g1_i1.p1  ORF type:complete len:132 (+),score=55.91 TRINITY_DN3746_c0_g1_i1:134-529(+)